MERPARNSYLRILDSRGAPDRAAAASGWRGTNKISEASKTYYLRGSTLLMQFRSNTLRIEHTSSHSLERTHQPSPALALLHLAGGLLRRRRLYAPAALRAADVLFVRRRPYAPPTRD